VTLTRRKPMPARPDRSGEFSSYVPRPRAPARVATLASVDLQPMPDVPRTKTAAEAEYMGRVAILGCIVCRLLGYGPTPAQVHHVRAGQGKAQRAGNYCVIPLCEPHHVGAHGIHGDRACLRQLNVTEMDLLDTTIGDIAGKGAP
jgi:hypothetical protein